MDNPIQMAIFNEQNLLTFFMQAKQADMLYHVWFILKAPLF